MAHTDDMPPLTSPAPRSAWEACDHCQAPLDERQRYCVACGARRTHADDPVARYFATTARRARASTAAMPASAHPSRPASGIRTTLVLALLPLVAAIGVVVGRGATNGDDRLVEALKAQKAPVVNVSGGGGTGVGASAAGGKDKRKASDAQRDTGGHSAADGKVIAETRYGTARQLTGAKPTEAQREESKQAIDRIVHSKGKAYVESQRNLPDQIIVP